MMMETVLSRSIRLMFAGGIAMGLGMAATAQAQELPGATPRVEITGSSIKRMAAESSLPVTTISKEDIARSGVTSVEALLQTITSVSTAGSSQGANLAGLSTYGLSSVSLRGLGDQRTLVLVNGKRMAVFAGSGGAVDVNAIPFSAIERIEVLRDGASGVYGSDAVAGVVNFILREDYTGLEIGGSYNSPTRSGDGKSGKANFVFGKGNLEADGFNFMVAGEFEKAHALFAKDRDFAKTGNIKPYISSAATETGRIEGIFIPGKTVSQNARVVATNPFGYSSSGYGNPKAPDNCADISMYSSGKGGVGGKFDNCKFDSGPFVGLFPEIERTNLVGSAKYKLNSDTTLYADALYARNKVKETYQPAPARIGFFQTDNAFAGSGVDPALLIFPSNPNYQSVITPYLLSHNLAAMNGQPLAITLRAFLAGPRQETDTNTQSRFNAGVKGTVFKDWEYNVSFTTNQSKTDGKLTDGYYSQLELARVLNNPANNWNPFAPGGIQDAALTAKLQGAKYTGATITGKSTSTGGDASITGTLMNLPAGPLQLATGLSTRRDSYDISVPAILGSGDIAGLGGATPPESSSRNVQAIFAELNIPILKSLEANVAARTDHYSDVGNTTNGKASMRFTVTPNVLLRGSVGTGFRAPTLVELHKPSSVGASEQFIDPKFPADGAVQPNAIAGGNSALKPEKSKQASIGIVLQPLASVSLGVDYFHVKIDNLIAGPSALSLVNAARAGKPLYGPGDVVFAPDGTVDTVDQTLRNANGATVEGFDIDFRFKQAFAGAWKFTANLNGTYTSKYDYKTLNGVQSSVGTIVQPDGSPLDIAQTGVVFRWKHNMALNLQNGPWSGTLVQNFQSGYRDADDLNGKRHDVGAFSTYDGQIAYTGVKNLKLSAGVRNLFDRNPPLAITNKATFQSGYDPSYYDARARTAYVTANYKFF
ncbi:MAG: TonB-dependent receptor [Herminiimonas sp.]|nr:TonB-dependent receptor [Herminiimonas sp.]